MTTLTAATEALLRNDLHAYWMPFTANRAFKQSPRLLAYAKDMHYFSPEGRAIIDGSAGVWCANAGHCRASIVEAIRAQAGELLFPPPFQFGHPKAFVFSCAVIHYTSPKAEPGTQIDERITNEKTMLGSGPREGHGLVCRLRCAGLCDPSAAKPLGYNGKF
jgi:hypothetical protein